MIIRLSEIPRPHQRQLQLHTINSKIATDDKSSTTVLSLVTSINSFDSLEIFSSSSSDDDFINPMTSIFLYFLLSLKKNEEI